MNYEKKYKEALENARQEYNNTEYNTVENVERKKWLEELFPELKESEDEKIRKWLISQLKIKSDDTNFDLNIMIDKAISWLEKQGKQEQLYIRFGEIPTDEKSKIYQGEIEVGTENGVSVYPAFKTDEGDIVLGLILPITKTTLYTQQHLLEYDDRPCYLVKGDYVGKDTDGQYLINNVSIIEKIDTYRVKEKKQDEQKFEMKSPEKSLGISSEEYNDIVNECLYGESNSSDKIEPKFHEGDWVVINGFTIPILITDVHNDLYDTIFANGEHRIYDTNVIDKDAHLWTIQDAKDGDVLCTYECEEPKIVFILKGTPKKHYALSYYCYYNIMYPHFDDGNKPGCLAPEDSDVKPATKEQRDLLFQKMKEAGYEWDAEKKKLKKISQHIVSAEAKEALYDKPTWSEKDEEFLRRAINATKDIYPMTANWLKSLKDRFTWKPSDEQIECLYDAVKHYQTNGYPASKLNELYEQMSKIYKL